MGGLALWLFKYRFLGLLILLESLGAWITLSNVEYHNSRFTQLQIETAGHYQKKIKKFTRFMGLDEENQRLNNEIALLKRQLSGDSLRLNNFTHTDSAHSKKSRVDLEQSSSVNPWPTSHVKIDFISPARVIFCGEAGQNNFMLLDRGSLNGIQPRMAVVQEDKIVGQVQAVSKHFARVVPLINTKIRISALHPKSQTVGILAWDGKSTRYAELIDFPIHIPIKIGDTLVSSSYSSVYPPGLRLGRIDRIEINPGAVTYKIRVFLTADYKRLDHVQVIRMALQNEREEILPNTN